MFTLSRAQAFKLKDGWTDKQNIIVLWCGC